MAQAGSRAASGCLFRVDCLPCVLAFKAGRVWATADRRPLARVHAQMFAALEGVPPEAMVWMPAHTSEDDIGIALLGDGSRLSKVDRDSNAETDRLAKEAVKEHRVPKVIRDQLKRQDALTEATARWVARATHAAGHQKSMPFRDTEASRQMAAIAAQRRAKLRADGGRPRRNATTVRPVALGGHRLHRDAGVWTCACCRKRS